MQTRGQIEDKKPHCKQERLKVIRVAAGDEERRVLCFEVVGGARGIYGNKLSTKPLLTPRGPVIRD